MKSIAFKAVIAALAAAAALATAPGLAQSAGKGAMDTASQNESAKPASSARHRKGWLGDARGCLLLNTRTQIIRCTEQYL